jgi:thiol:disulfide interchange protein DsbC
MFTKWFKTALPGLLLTGMTMNVLASDVEKIQAKLKEVIPNAPAAIIEKSPVAGVYQVSVGPNVIYMSADAKYLFNGSLVDLTTRENLTEMAKNTARMQALSKMDEASMVVFPAKGKAKHTLTVFTDIDCPYCKKFHNDVATLNENGISVRYLAFPRSGPETPSYHKMVSIWCAKDRVKAMDDAKKGKDVAQAKCENPIMEQMIQAQNFGISGTPTLILDNGQMIPGYVPAQELIQALGQ